VEINEDKRYSIPAPGRSSRRLPNPGVSNRNSESTVYAIAKYIRGVPFIAERDNLAPPRRRRFSPIPLEKAWIRTGFWGARGAPRPYPTSPA
jgi:hypothetical protein